MTYFRHCHYCLRCIITVIGLIPGKDVFIGHGGKLQEDSLEEQYRTLLILNVVLNCIAFWNTLAIQQIVEELRNEGHEISQEKLRYVTPTMLNHIDLIGKFEINLDRIAPFEFAKAEKISEKP